MSWELHLDMRWAPSSLAGPSSAAPTPKLTSLLFSGLPSLCPLLAWRDISTHRSDWLHRSSLRASFSDANMCSVPYSRNTGQRSPTAGSVAGRGLWWWSLWDLDDLRDRTHSQSSRVKQLPLNTNCREICEHRLSGPEPLLWGQTPLNPSENNLWLEPAQVKLSLVILKSQKMFFIN